MAAAPADPVTGRRRQATRTVKVKGRRAAQQELARFLVELGDQPAPTPRSRPPTRAQGKTVTDAVDAWMAQFDALVAAGVKSPATAEYRRRQIATYITPTLGPRPLADVAAQDVNELYTQLLTVGKPARAATTDGARRHGRISPPRPLGVATCRQVRVILRGAFDYAIEHGWTTTNPAARKSQMFTGVKGDAPTPPTDIQARALLAEAERVDPEWGCLLRLQASAGLRRGETTALRWSAVDLEAATLTVTRVVTVGAGNGLVVRDRPKSGRGYRQVSLDPFMVTSLRSQRRRQRERAMVCGTRPVDDAYVFSPVLDGSEPMHPRVVTSRFMRLRDRVGYPDVRLHDLRHYVASQLIAAGIDVTTVAGRLGHDPAMTLRTYSHYQPARDQAAATIMGDLLGGDSRQLPSRTGAS